MPAVFGAIHRFASPLPTRFVLAFASMLALASCGGGLNPVTKTNITISGFSPGTVSTQGNSTITVSGTNFTKAYLDHFFNGTVTAAKFTLVVGDSTGASTAATVVQPISDTTVVVNVPALPAGTYVLYLAATNPNVVAPSYAQVGDVTVVAPTS